MTRVVIEDWAVDDAGSVVSAAQISVRDEADELVTLYSAATGTGTITNPFNAGDGTLSETGFFSFWVDAGQTITINVGEGASLGSKRVFTGLEPDDYAPVSVVAEVGTDDGFGALFDRAPFQHGAPFIGPLVRTGTDTYALPKVPLALMRGAVVAGEGYVLTADGGWPISDGAADSGPTVYEATVEDNFYVVRSRPYTGYAPGPALLRLPLDTPWSLSPEVTEVRLIVYHGQSQAVANSGEALTTTAPSADRLAMFAGGIAMQHSATTSYGTIERKHWLIGEDFLDGGLVPMREGTSWSINNETPLTSLCAAILPDLPDHVGLVGIGAAAGGREVAELGPGNGCWHNIALAAGYLRALCERRNITFRLDALFWSQGGANVDSDDLAGYVAAFNADIRDPWRALVAAHGQAAGSAPIFTTQMTHNATVATMEVSRAQLQLALDNTDIVMTTPEYVFRSRRDDGIGTDDADNVHIGARGIIQRGNIEAAAYKRVVIDGGSWEPLRMLTAVRSGATVTIGTNIAQGQFTAPILADNPDVTAVANAGFSWIDNGDGNAVTISGVSIDGSNNIVLTLSATPTGTGQQIGYALGGTAVEDTWQGPVNGARGEICDSTTATVSVPGGTRSLRRALAVQIIDVTT